MPKVQSVRVPDFHEVVRDMRLARLEVLVSMRKRSAVSMKACVKVGPLISSSPRNARQFGTDVVCRPSPLDSEVPS